MSKRGKRVRILPIFMVAVLCCAIAYGIFAFVKPIPVLAAQKVSSSMAAVNTATAQLPWANYGESAVGATGYGVLATHGAQTSMPTASVAKIMTALAVLKKEPLTIGQQGPTITITQADQKIYDYYYARDGSLAAIKVGEKISEYQALEAMLLPSANNFADTLAIWAYGSMDGYTAFANSYAKTLGMADSHFVDGSGFSPQTISTAQDLVRLGEVAMQNPVITQIVGEKQATVPVAGIIDNVNWLLGTDGIIGVKTGNNDQDKGAFLFAARYTTGGTPITLVGVVMGGPNLTKAMDDSLPLLKASKANLQKTTIVSKGEVVGHYDVPWSSNVVTAVATNDIKVITWQGQKLQPVISLNNIRAATTKGSTVGKVTTTLPHSTTVPVELQQDIPAAPWYWRVLR